MPKDKPELTSHELIREAREALAAPPFDETPGGPTVQELLAAPESKATRHGASTDPSAWSYSSVSPSSELLSSESLLLRRSADLWTNDRSDSRDTSAPSVTPAEAELPTPSEIAAPAMELSLLPAPPEHWPPPVSHFGIDLVVLLVCVEYPLIVVVLMGVPDQRRCGSSRL